MSAKKEGKEDYRFAGKVIRLTVQDFTAWETRYHTIPDLEAELGGLDEWWDRMHPPGDKKRKDWWPALTAILNRKHQELVEKRY